ncbi:profilin-1-like [Perognathus longimembris pacificus]|uniref:profilin-1-like n=1 Tax=Perognathus longimembris pacificus TaxID=214514 RepID=UPI0020184392|nr:profilin-1-like [Perognathus longimembris pacificus]
MENIGEISEELWQDCITVFQQNDMCSDVAVVTNGPPWVLASYPRGNLVNMTPEEIQILVRQEEREKFFMQGITLAGIKCLLIRDNLYLEGTNTMDLRTKSQSRASQAVTIIQIESVYLVVIGQKGAEGGPLNLKAFEMANYIREAVLHHTTAI